MSDVLTAPTVSLLPSLPSRTRKHMYVYISTYVYTQLHLENHYLRQIMLYQGDFGPKGHLAMSKKISGCQSWEGTTHIW